ncbi:hydantoinase B/oxoprolinase family protein [Halorarius halobius]|uniref:hydantoinase B/oxoprolinase family protein n=1 Tax=Halorarius halobius TaxID=2962671 RepID=UPI0020CE894C|nr:hydantoinase B/oxoprolinase family protein [Halorarius halobius]
MSTTESHPDWVADLKAEESDAEPEFVGDHDIDPTTLDIIENTLLNTRYEMDRVLETTAFSPAIREQSDQFPLIADREGRMIAGQFGSEIDKIIENSPYELDDLEEGDVLATNDPYLTDGSISHNPDFILLRPIFYEDDLVGFSKQWGNLADVGGIVPGSIPIEAETIHEEGVRLPPVKLFKAGELDEELLSTFTHNTRTADVNEADIKAISAGTKAAEKRVKELCDRFGKETYLEACDAVLDRTRRGVTELFREHIPEHEEFVFWDYSDDDGLGHGPIRLELKMYRDGDDLYLTFEGSDPQVPGTVNFILNTKMFKMFVGLFVIMTHDPKLTFNDGYFDRVHVDIPAGSILNPEYPAAVSNRLPTMTKQHEVLQGVFSMAFGEEFSAGGSYGTNPNLVYSGVDDEGTPFQLLELLYGGIPARPAGDGLDGHSWWPLFYTVPVEYLEAYYPLRVDAYEANVDSGGAGEHRGGHGIRRTYTFKSDGTLTYQDDRALTNPPGVDGGNPAGNSEKILVREDGTEEHLPSKVENLPVEAGDQLVFITAGGGGLGDPLDRDAETVAREVRQGLVSREAAVEEYGVVLADDDTVDEAATADRRATLREERDELGTIDRGPIPSERELADRIAAAREEYIEKYKSGISEWEGKQYGD